jgi:hypothetical protein
VFHNADPDLIVPIPFEQYLRTIGDEIFELFGRGAAEGELYCLAGIDEPVGDQVLVNLMHRPNAVVGQSPVSQRGGERRVLILQRTEEPAGPKLLVMDAVVAGSEEVGTGGGTEEEDDPEDIVEPVAPIAFASGYGEARGVWQDSYPQFTTFLQWEDSPPGSGVFSALYGGENQVEAGIFEHVQTGFAAGWDARFRYRLTDGALNSGWSPYSNTITVTGSPPPAAPTDIPDNLVATSTTTDEVHAAWTNTNGSLQIRIQFQGSATETGTYVNVAGGTRTLAAATDEADQATGAALWGRFRAAYVNASGVLGPWADYSDPVEIMT